MGIGRFGRPIASTTFITRLVCCQGNNELEFRIQDQRKDRRDWKRWQEYRPQRNDFNRPLIFSLARFYHEPDMWLFGGIFKVTARRKDGYKVELTEAGSGFIGRPKLRSPYSSRLVRVKMEGSVAIREAEQERGMK